MLLTCDLLAFFAAKRPRPQTGHRIALTITLLAAVLAARPSSAQTQEAKPDGTAANPYTLHVKSRLVTLDVVVTDHDGHVRNDLTREDFHLTEDGVAQTLLSFEPPAAHTIPTAAAEVHSTAELEARAPQAPVNVIVLDEMNTSFQAMGFARYALGKYLNAQKSLPPTMLVAVNFDKFTVLQDYTQDRAAILSALNHHLTHYPWNLERSESKIRTLALSLGVLEQVAQATAGHPGHKNLIWVGRGFPGIDLTSPNYDQDQITGINAAMQQIVNMLRDSRITMYTIDPTMLSATVATTVDADSIPGKEDSMDAVAPDPFETDASFTALARTSGGKAFYSRNDVDREIGESVRDGSNYYTISYRPANDSDEDKPYRKIRITFNMPGLHASYRDGYYHKDTAVPKLPGTRMTYDLAAAEESTMVYTGLHIIAQPKPGVADAYLVGVPQRELVWDADGDKESAKLILVAACLDGKDRILRRTSIDLTAHRPAGTSGAGGEGKLARLEISLPTAPGAYRLRFVVRGVADGRMGTADLKVPGAPPPPRPSR